jgi:hypothetical protein
MKKSLFSLFVLILILGFSLGISNDANAQPAKKAKERIKQIKMVKLLNILDLDDKTSDKFIAKYSSLDRDVENIREDIEIASDELELAIKKSEPKDEISKKVEKLIQLDDKLAGAIMEKFKQLKPILNDTQYAILVVFEHKFPRELQRILFERGIKGRGNIDRGPDD